jgi:ribosomal protein S20
MPIGRSAKKSLRKAVKNKKSNVSFKAKIKLAIKTFLVKPSEKSLVEVQSILDKAKKKNIFNKNKIDRIKSRLSKKIAKK